MRMYVPLFIVITGFILPTSAFGQKISGRVLNEGGRGAFYVTVQFKDKANPVFTDDEGRFTIIAKKLPDTLFFSAGGFEPYKIVVSEETTKDANFEVVLLNTRRKIKTADVPVTTFIATKNNNGGSQDSNSEDKPNSGKKQDPSDTGPGSYIAGKKLLMIDTVSSKNGSVMYRSGLLAAGEVNDFNHERMWEDFPVNEYKTYSDRWNIYPNHRFSVQLLNKDHTAVIGQRVSLINKKTNDTAWSAVTDNTGKVELWGEMKGVINDPDYSIITEGAAGIDAPVPFPVGINKMEVNVACSVPGAIDIAMVVDATGSMNSEIDFLKIELEDVIRNTFAAYKDLDLRIGSVFYRDKNDEYLTRHVDLQHDLLKVLNFIKLQRASGGGDVPEAVDRALQTSLDSLHWNLDARSRILFLITDAPPHDESKEKIFQLIKMAAAKGIRMVPVVCSGADKSTEFIMRSMALATNGTYVFLADDSHADFSDSKSGEGVFNVEYFNTMLERIINQMVFTNPCGEQQEAERSRTMPPNIENIRIDQDPVKKTITIESKNHLKELFVTDFTGKILWQARTPEKQNKWEVDISALPGATYFIKYLAGDDQWGAEKFVRKLQQQ